jgi:hypothetical protein
VAADGTWNLTLQTPVGERAATLALSSSGTTLNGQQSAEGNTENIFDGTINGNAVAWKVNISRPMPMTLEFNGTVEGNMLSGSMKAGSFGSWPFTGQRT